MCVFLNKDIEKELYLMDVFLKNDFVIKRLIFFIDFILGMFGIFYI